jgi:hypothetical protein
VQRFRVTSRSLEKSDGILTAQFSAISYKGLFDAAIFHPEYTRVFASAEQTATAWSIIQAAFGATNTGPQWLGITNRRAITTAVNKAFSGPPASFDQRTNFFDVGQTILSGIRAMAEQTNGFEWDVVPDPTNPMTALQLGFWNLVDGGRNQFGAGRSSFLLTDGGTVTSWSHTVTPEYGNVIRYTGGTATATNFVSGTASGEVWVPSTKVPAETGTGAIPNSIGRWEKDVQDSDESDTAAVTNGAQAAFDRVNLYTPEISLNLARGRWQGPSQLWLGDKARLIITEAVAGSAANPAVPSDWVLYVDEDVRVVEISVSVDDLGAEDVSVSINRPAYSATRDMHDIYDRLKNLERR